MDIWTITIKSPMGETTAQLQFEQNGTVLAGDMTGKGGSGPIEKGRISEDQISWSCNIQKPLPMTLKFNGILSGDEMTGKVKFGMFASGTFIAVRG